MVSARGANVLDLAAVLLWTDELLHHFETIENQNISWTFAEEFESYQGV